MLRLLARRFAPEPPDVEPDGRPWAVALERLRSLRDDVVARLREATSVSEREVYAAGQSLNRVVDLASSQVDALRSLLGSRTQSGRGSADEQVERTRTFLRTLHSALDEQTSHADRSLEQAQVIAEMSQRVGALASQARMLAINARIEAAHAGAAGGAFGILAGEMRRLAEEIAGANSTIKDLVDEVSEAAPRMSKSVAALKLQTDSFSTDFSDGMHNIEADRAEAEETVQRVLAASDEASQAIVQAALDTLSHLQFQDVVSQGLMRIDARLREHQVSMARAFGQDPDSQNFPAAAHVEVGGEKPIDAPDAGVVQLF